MIDILFVLIFISGIYYLIGHRLNVKKAADSFEDAVYPQRAEEFSGILLPVEWKEMEPMTKETRSYQIVKWGTAAALLLLILLLAVVLATDWLDTSFFSFAYLFIALANAVRHRGNFFVVPKGIILNSRYYSFSQIKKLEIEKVIKWHQLYGYNSRVDNGYKLTFKIRNKLFQPSFFVVEELEQLEKITDLLAEKGVSLVNINAETTGRPGYLSKEKGDT